MISESHLSDLFYFLYNSVNLVHRPKPHSVGRYVVKEPPCALSPQAATTSVLPGPPHGLYTK